MHFSVPAAKQKESAATVFPSIDDESQWILDLSEVDMYHK